MRRRLTIGLCVLLALASGLAASPGRAASPQIEDPAGDHPVPFMDFTAVTLSVGHGKSGPYLETTFTLAGLVGDVSQTSMTGYSFTAKVGKCDLLVRYIGYPEGVAGGTEFATTKCGAGGRDIGGKASRTENTITVQSPLRDLKGVAVGQTMTNLAAFNTPAEGQYHDETTAPSVLGDAASSDKSWVIG